MAVLRLVESEEDRAELVRRLDVVSERERQATAVIITREVERALTLYEIIEFPIRLPPPWMENNHTAIGRFRQWSTIHSYFRKLLENFTSELKEIIYHFRATELV